MIIILVREMLTQKQNEVISTTSFSLGPMRGLCQLPESFLYIIYFQLLFRVTWYDNAYELERYHVSNKNGMRQGKIP